MASLGKLMALLGQLSQAFNSGGARARHPRPAPSGWKSSRPVHIPQIFWQPASLPIFWSDDTICFELFSVSLGLMCVVLQKIRGQEPIMIICEIPKSPKVQLSSQGYYQ